MILTSSPTSRVLDREAGVLDEDAMCREIA